MQVEKMYQTRFTYMSIDEKHIIVKDNERHEQSCRAVTVYPGLQIELGRRFEDYKEALGQTRLPLVFKKLSIPSRSCLNYQLIRMGTGKVKDKIILNIIVKDAVIYAISFNKDLRNDMEYRKYNQLSITNQLSLPALDINKTSDMELKFGEQVQRVIEVLFKGFGEFVGAEYKTEKISINIAVDNEELVVNFILNRKNNMYELISLELV